MKSYRYRKRRGTAWTCFGLGCHTITDLDVLSWMPIEEHNTFSSSRCHCDDSFSSTLRKVAVCVQENLEWLFSRSTGQVGGNDNRGREADSNGARLVPSVDFRIEVVCDRRGRRKERRTNDLGYGRNVTVKDERGKIIHRRRKRWRANVTSDLRAIQPSETSSCRDDPHEHHPRLIFVYDIQNLFVPSPAGSVQQGGSHEIATTSSL
jgi:hypothetical protein